MQKKKIKEIAFKRLNDSYEALTQKYPTLKDISEHSFRLSYIVNLASYLDFVMHYCDEDSDDFDDVCQVIGGLEELGFNWFEQVYAWAVSRDASFNMDSFLDWAVEFSDYEDKFFVLKTVKEAAKKRKEKLNRKDA